MGFSQASVEKKQSMEWKHTDSSKEVLGTAVNKEGHAGSLLGHKKSHQN